MTPPSAPLAVVCDRVAVRLAGRLHWSGDDLMAALLAEAPALGIPNDAALLRFLVAVDFAAKRGVPLDRARRGAPPPADLPRLLREASKLPWSAVAFDWELASRAGEPRWKAWDELTDAERLRWWFRRGGILHQLFPRGETRGGPRTSRSRGLFRLLERPQQTEARRKARQRLLKEIRERGRPLRDAWGA